MSPAESAPARHGLSEAVARERLAQVGPNVLTAGHRRALVLQLLSRFRNPLVLLLLAASVISAVTHDVTSSTIIVVVIVLSVTLDFVQEHRAGKAAEQTPPGGGRTGDGRARGRDRELPAEEVVPGDVILLSAGDSIPADGTLTEATHLFVNQALLTGEPFPVEKRPARPENRSSRRPNRRPRWEPR